MVIQLHENQCSQVKLNRDLSRSSTKESKILSKHQPFIIFRMMHKRDAKDLDEEDEVFLR